MTTDFPTASVGSSQALTADVEKSQSASHTEILTPPPATRHRNETFCRLSVYVFELVLSKQVGGGQHALQPSMQRCQLGLTSVSTSTEDEDSVRWQRELGRVGVSVHGHNGGLDSSPIADHVWIDP